MRPASLCARRSPKARDMFSPARALIIIMMIIIIILIMIILMIMIIIQIV